MVARHIPSSRRSFLRKITSLGVMGTIAALRAPGGLASSGINRGLEDFSGDIIRKGEEGYEDWRKAMMWHLSKPSRKPDIIVQAKTERDVIDAVNYARRNDLKIASRSSGHNSTGSVLRHGGMLLDLSYMRDIEINMHNKSALVGPALWNMQLIEEAGKHGLSFPAAHCGSVAIGGYVLGGGLGWNHKHYGGAACHSVKSMNVITADGRKLRASARENPDLYWAARGAGPGFFGVVTQLELQLYPAPNNILVSMYIHPLDNISLVTSALEKLVEIKDDRVEVLLLLMHNHQAPEGTPPEQAKICFIGLNAFATSEAEARELLKPFAESELAKTSVFKSEYQGSSFHKLYNPENVDTGLGRYAVDTDWIDDLSGALSAVADHFRTTSSPRSHFVASLDINTALHDNASFSRVGRHFVGSYLVWDEEKDDEINYDWLEENHDLLQPFSKGHYVNEIAGDRYPDRYRACFSGESWQRLQALRKEYDPTGVFHNYLGHS